MLFVARFAVVIRAITLLPKKRAAPHSRFGALKLAIDVHRDGNAAR